MTLLRVYQRGADDCFRACIASIMGWSYEQAPDMMNAERSAQMAEGETRRLDVWFRERNLVLLRFPFPAVQDRFALRDTLELISFRQPYDVRYIISGLTIKGVSHAVVAQGGKVIHDPANPAQPIYAPYENGVFWTYFIGLA